MHILLFVGFAATIGQVILVRELLSVFHGDELSIGIILGHWLLWTAVGSLVGTRHLVKWSDPRRLMVTGFSILAVTLPACLIFAGLSRFIFAIKTGEMASLGDTTVIAFLSVFPYCLVSGTLFPLGCNLYGPQRSNIWQAYFFEALGAAIGGMVFTFGLVRLGNPLKVALIVSLFLIAATYAFKKTRYPLVLAIPLFLALLLSNHLADLIQQACHQGLTLLETTDSRHGKLTILTREKQTYFYENGVFLFSYPDVQAVEDIVHPALLQLDNPREILLIGGGISGTIGEILRYPTIKKVDYVELDPAIVSLARKHLPPGAAEFLDDPRVRIIHDDARRFITTTACRYDIVLIQLPDPFTTMINRFYTREFFDQIKPILKRKGLCAFQASSAEEVLSPVTARYLKSLLASLRNAFPEVMIIPGGQAYFLAAPQRGTLTLDEDRLLERLRSAGIRTRFFQYYLPYKLDPMRRDCFFQTLAAYESRPNLDLSPVSYLYSNLIWSVHLEPSTKEAVVSFLHSRKTVMAVAALFFLILLVTSWRREKQAFQKTAMLTAVAITGFSQILLEIVIILLFQVAYGYVYYKIGLLIALYMAGLSLGSMTVPCNPLLSLARGRLSRIQGVLSLELLILILLIVLLFHRSSAHSWEYIFYTGILLISATGGSHFALSAQKLPMLQAGSVGGILYGVDLLGSFLGAALSGVILIPVFGIVHLLYFLLALNLLTSGLLAWARA